ncbi:MAG: hypothetical protein RR185_07280 [Angelakisella sp.]
MAYATYLDYTTRYGGFRLDQAQFERYAPRAGDCLELLTYGRCADDKLPSWIVLAVTKACCAVAEELCAQDSQPDLLGHTVGDWSRTYAPQKSREKRLADAARVYLRKTGLLWRGWSRTEARI